MSKGNYFENQFKVVGMHNGEEIIEVKGVAIDWGDGAEEIYFYHPITGQKINEARKLLQGWKPVNPEMEELWYQFIDKLESLDGEHFFEMNGENNERIIIELEKIDNDNDNNYTYSPKM